MKHDVVVIGAGLAGLTAGIRLAQEGLDVALFATGHGALPLAPAVVDVLGYVPHRVQNPWVELPAFVAKRSQHPYARLSMGALAASVDWFKDIAAPLGYAGSLERNQLLPTAVGGLRPTVLVPETMVAGELSGGGDVLIVGISGYRDFYPSLVAQNLSASSPAADCRITARAVEVALAGDPRDLRPQLLSRRLEEPQVRADLARSIRAELRTETAVGLPAVLGLERSHEVWSDLEQWIGRPVFEIPTIPPSLPGQRLQALLIQVFRRFGGRLQIGNTVVAGHGGDGHLESVTVAQASREVSVSAGHFVLATGGVGTAGIVVDRAGTPREAVLGLPVSFGGLSGEVGGEYFGTHPLDRMGVAVDARLRPTGGESGHLFANLHAAGATLAGAEPWKEKSGDGISLATGFAAAAAILEDRA
ncbi:MAG: anaerobic glycerol-3-phosphate dehydrogenase subunit GlpB [Candidatus Dormibacteria bacterium]